MHAALAALADTGAKQAEQRIGLTDAGAEALEAAQRNQAQQEQAAEAAELDWPKEPEESELSRELEAKPARNQL